MAGTPIDQISARKLTQKLRLERLVWLKHFSKLTDSHRTTAENLKPGLTMLTEPMGCSATALPLPVFSSQQIMQRAGNHLGGAAQVLQIQPLVGTLGV